MPDRTRYREVNYIGGRYLEARELNLMQDIARQTDSTNIPSAYEMNALYRDGASLNIALTIVGKQITFSAADGTNPMLVFVRGQWEKLKSSEAAPITLTSGTNIYLNYTVQQTTSADDAQLIDASTAEATAEMGELLLSVSATDTSIAAGPALQANQFERNPNPIILFLFTQGSNTVTLVPQDNVKPQAKANNNQGGLVTMSTGTSSVACATDDPRLTNARAPSAGSVVDASVYVPVAAGGNNADGTPIYTDGSGVSAGKIIYRAGTQLLSDIIAWLKTQFNTLQASFTAHSGATLGQVNTHPMPTAQQVGATPSSHQGEALGLSDSHPPVAVMNQGGFRLQRDVSVPPTAGDYSFATVETGSTRNGLRHDGDIFSILANAVSASPIAPATTTGPLGLISTVAKVLSEHVNQTSHGNPHGLTLADLGGAGVTQAYVDAQDAATLTSSHNYTNAVVPGVTLRLEAVSGGAFLIIRFAPNNGNAIEVAYGTGSQLCQPFINYSIALPVSFSSASSLASIAVQSIDLQNGDIADVITTQSGLNFTGQVDRYNGSGRFTGSTSVRMTWTCIAWRQGA
jgi:hypothetical protein